MDGLYEHVHARELRTERYERHHVHRQRYVQRQECEQHSPLRSGLRRWPTRYCEPDSGGDEIWFLIPVAAPKDLHRAVHQLVRAASQRLADAFERERQWLDAAH